MVRVFCYSGRKGDERPVRFEIDGRVYAVEEIVNQWYTPHESCFKVRADDGNVYVLRQSPEGEWTLTAAR
jgi:hypothetical protein